LSSGRTERPFEQRLVARLQAGEAEALGALFEIHVDGVFAFAQHLIGNREDAEDVTSEAFLRAFQRAAAFRGECPFRGWLFGIVRNLCIDRMRQPRLLLEETGAADRYGAPDGDIERVATRSAVLQALASIQEEYRIVLALCDVEGWDASEAAVALDRSLAATKSLLYRARRALRDQLTRLWDEEEMVDPVRRTPDEIARGADAPERGGG
jgi:RNA polymerase sigma-70 factor (ECF subfamily)